MTMICRILYAHFGTNLMSVFFNPVPGGLQRTTTQQALLEPDNNPFI